MRARATALLIAAAALWLGVRLGTDGDGAWGYAEAAAEAGMIGGLADWFAVTALFRHPLRIPIPHTAIIPTRKDDIGRALGSFVSENFLRADIVAERLEGVPMARTLGEWMAEPENAAKVAERTGGLRPILGQAIEAAIQDGQHRPLVDAAIRGIAGVIEDNRELLRQRVHEESPGWVPVFLDDRVFDRAYKLTVAFLEELRENPEHEVRIALDHKLKEMAHEYREPETIPGLPDTVTRAGEKLATDPQLQRTVDGWLVSAAGYAVERYGSEVGTLIETTVVRWDARDTSARIEAAVGDDLQYIRINGTIVGGLAGVALHAISEAIG